MATAPTSSTVAPTSEFQALLDLIPLPAWIFDAATLRFVCVNEAAVVRYGFSRGEFLRMTITDIRPPAERPLLLEQFARYRNEPTHRSRWWHQTRSGDVFQVEVSTRALVLEGRQAHFVVASDMTEHLRLQEALFHSRRRLQALFDNALDAILLANDAGEYVDANAAACALLGCNRDDILQLHVWDLLADESARHTREGWSAFLKEGRMSGGYRLRARDGTSHEVEFSSVANVLPGLHLAILRDVTRETAMRREAQERLRESHEQSRRVAARARARREEDRTRMARELHDQLGQALAALKIDLHWVGQQITTGVQVRSDDLTGKIDCMMRLVDETLSRVRRISSELRPPVLDKLGLLAAVEWEAEEFARRTHIRTRVKAEVEHVGLDRGRSTAVFRMLQEALVNVAAHAAASNVKISVSVVAGRLRIGISDDGRGIGADQTTGGVALGILGMRERASLLGGGVAIRRGRRRGTVVTIGIPLAERRSVPRDDWND
jgi:PAS domain S-box-containing protein